MNKIKSIFKKAETKVMMTIAGAIDKTEKGDHLLEVLGTIIIAVVILVLFKSAILNIFTSALNNTTSSVSNLFSNVTGG